MFQKKQRIYSETLGACIVDNLVQLPTGKGQNATYYVLKSVFDATKVAYIPAVNHQVALRELFSKEEAEKVKSMKPSVENEDETLYMDMFSDLMNAIVARDLLGALECAESASSLDSREKQKAFCIFAGECIRKIFMIRQNMMQIAGVAEHEKDFFLSVAARCNDTFCQRSVTNIEKVVGMIDRNVNSKILFCDLVNRMFLSI